MRLRHLYSLSIAVLPLLGGCAETPRPDGQIPTTTAIVVVLVRLRSTTSIRFCTVHRLTTRSSEQRLAARLSCWFRLASPASVAELGFVRHLISLPNSSKNEPVPDSAGRVGFRSDCPVSTSHVATQTYIENQFFCLYCISHCEYHAEIYRPIHETAP